MQSIAVPKFWAARPFPVLSSLLRAMIRFGQLTIIDARGRIRDFGDLRSGPSITLRFQELKGTDLVSYGGLVGFPSNGRYVIAVAIKRPSGPSVSFDFDYEKQAQ